MVKGVVNPFDRAGRINRAGEGIALVLVLARANVQLFEHGIVDNLSHMMCFVIFLILVPMLDTHLEKNVVQVPLVAGRYGHKRKTYRFGRYYQCPCYYTVNANDEKLTIFSIRFGEKGMKARSRNVRGT